MLDFAQQLRFECLQRGRTEEILLAKWYLSEVVRRHLLAGANPRHSLTTTRLSEQAYGLSDVWTQSNRGTNQDLLPQKSC
jgi:hypothetical protein